MKKKYLIFAATIGLFLSIIITSCTDVPISYSTKIPNSKILGYWQLNDTEAIQIFKSGDGSASIVELDYDKDNQNWKKGKSKKIYFATISDDKSTDHFFSYEKMPDTYITAKFKFNSFNELAIAPLSHDFLKKYNETNSNEVVLFKSVGNFQKFVKFNKKYSAFYDKKKKEIRYRKKSIQDLDTPKKIYASSKNKKPKNLGLWVSPYQEQYLAFYDDGTIDRYLYYDNEAQWVGHNYNMDNRNQVIRVTKTSTGRLYANIYFTTEGKMIWEYVDRSRKNIVFRKVGAFEPELPKDRSFSLIDTWSTRNGELIVTFFPRRKAVVYRPLDRNYFPVDYDYDPNKNKISFVYSNGYKEISDYEVINDNHLVIRLGGKGKRHHLYKERDTEKFNRGAEAAASLLNLLFSSGNSNSNSSLSTDNYSGSSWLKNEHERQTLDRARGN